jgi:prepilin-type N-terminal cleavage/methylation domain-containing protein
VRAINIRQTAPARRGFTLVELLVVIGLIAILAALTISVIGGVMNAQTLKATNNTLDKLSTLLNQQWKAVIDQANDEFPSIPTINPNFARMTANWNPSTAKSLWRQLRLRQEFPTSFNEALNPVVYSSGGYQVKLLPKAYYVQNLKGAVSTGANFEASACLYLALSVARRGMVGSLEESVGQSSIQNQNGVNVIVDLWNSPIAYLRGNEQTGVTPTPPNPPFPVLISAGPNRVYESNLAAGQPVPGGDDLMRSVTITGAARGD